MGKEAGPERMVHYAKLNVRVAYKNGPNNENVTDTLTSQNMFSIISFPAKSENVIPQNTIIMFGCLSVTFAQEKLIGVNGMPMPLMPLASSISLTYCFAIN